MKDRKLFTDIAIGDIVVVFDEYSHDYVEHKIKVESIEFDKEYITEGNPNGMVCYGTDLDEEEFGDDAITVVTIANFCYAESGEKMNNA